MHNPTALEQPLLHLHSEEPIAFAATIDEQLKFGCRRCIAYFWDFPSQTNFYWIDPKERVMYGQLCLDMACRSNPFMVAAKTIKGENIISTNFHPLVEKVKH
jgi:hypothetical protein